MGEYAVTAEVGGGDRINNEAAPLRDDFAGVEPSDRRRGIGDHHSLENNAISQLRSLIAGEADDFWERRLGYGARQRAERERNPRGEEGGG